MRSRYTITMHYDGSKTTGFMSPAGDHADSPIDLPAVLNLTLASRYPVRVKGSSLASRGILSGDILIVDASVDPFPGAVVVAFSGDEVTLAVAESSGRRVVLRRSDGVIIESSDDVWGVAVSLVRARV